MSRAAQYPIAELLRRVSAKLKAEGHDYETAAPVVGMSREWTRQLLEGAHPQRLNRTTRKQLDAYLAAATGAREPAPSYTVDTTFEAATGRAVLIAVGRLGFIKEMAEKIAEMAGRSEEELARAQGVSPADREAAARLADREQQDTRSAGAGTAGLPRLRNTGSRKRG